MDAKTSLREFVENSCHPKTPAPGREGLNCDSDTVSGESGESGESAESGESGDEFRDGDSARDVLKKVGPGRSNLGPRVCELGPEPQMTPNDMKLA